MSVEQLENLRKKIQKQKSIILMVYLIIFVVGIFLAITQLDLEFTSEQIISYLIMLMFPLVIMLILVKLTTMIVCGKSISLFTSEFKNTFVKNSLNQIFTNLTYKPELGLDKKVLDETKMIYTGDIYSSNDFISGQYKNVTFISSDVEIKERRETRDSDGHTSTTYVTIFLGKWYIFDFNKNFKANIQVVRKGFTASAFRKWSGFDFKKIELESETFNQEFKVSTNNEHEAFYILSPNFMEKLQNLCLHVNGDIMFGFIDNKLHIALHNKKDSFEPNLKEPIDPKKIEQQMNTSIKEITNFVEQLDLDDNLFKEDMV